MLSAKTCGKKLKWGCAWLAMRTHNGNYSGNNCARLKLFLNSLDFVAENWEQIFVQYCFIRKFCFDNFPLFIVRSAGTAFFAVVKKEFCFHGKYRKTCLFWQKLLYRNSSKNSTILCDNKKCRLFSILHIEHVLSFSYFGDSLTCNENQGNRAYHNNNSFLFCLM